MPSIVSLPLAPALLAGSLLLTPLPGAAQQTTAPAELNKVTDLVLYEDPQFYASFPSVVRRADGELLCAFRRAPSRKALWGARGDLHTDANSYLVMIRSTDNGKSWSREPELIFAHPMGGSQDPCLLQLRDGGLLCASYTWALLPPSGLDSTTETLKHGPYAFLGGYLLRQEAGACRWTGPITPPTLPGEESRDALNRPLATYNRGALLEQADGTLLWAVVRRDSLKPGRTSVHLIRSSDRGDSWQYGGPIAVDPEITFNETSLVETTGGMVAAFLRTETHGKKAAMALSRDGGRSFESWQDLGFSGFPLQAIPVAGGRRVLLVYGWRQAPYGIRARLVSPDFSDVKTAREYVLRDDGGNGDLGYPWAVELGDGKVLVSYYFNRGDGPRHIAGTMLELNLRD